MHQRLATLTTCAAIAFNASGCDSSQEGGAVDPVSEKVEKTSCRVDAFRALPDVRLTSATPHATPVAHCEVAGVIGTETHFQLLLPDDWNGKFVFGGGGGFVGQVVNTALGFRVLERGFATVGTDTGHEGNPLDASWALNDLERVVSFGHQAVHRTTVTAKALIGDFYRRDSERNLFFGCSRGGGQALMEAQRYPEDFDGIVAGAPAYNWTAELGGRNTWINQAMYPDPVELGAATITPEALETIGSAVMNGCDKLDGVEDGIISDPLVCDFDVTQLACTDSTEGGRACLTSSQIEAAQRVYDGFFIDEELVFPGYAPGGELGPGGWTRWIAGGLDVAEVADFQGGIEWDPRYPSPVAPSAHFAFGNGVMKFLVFHDPDWDYASYDFSTFESDTAAVASTLNATDPDLDAFRARGGKLLLFNGWRDMALSPLGTIQYYDEVVGRDETAAEDVRLIMIPGMDHCIGGPGPSFANWVDEIDRWVGTGQAPSQVTVHWFDEQMQPSGSRLACAYPTVLKYDGSGDPRESSSFGCEETPD